MQIEVTQDDILRGVRCRACTCPVALAICHHAGLAHGEVRVERNHVKMRNLVLWLDRKVERFIADFDSGVKVKPFSFELPIDPQAMSHGE